jgi:hypothetical protein
VRFVAAVLLAAALAAGCGGSERLPTIFVEPEAQGPDRDAGLTALRFVQAARSGDRERMRALMSAATRASFGPGTGRELAAQLAGFSEARIVLGQALDERWAVAAVAGRNDEGEPAAWAAALRRENDRWRVELGGIFFTRMRPVPLGEADPYAEIRVEAQAGGEVDELRAWIGRQPLRAYAFRRQPFTREIWGRLRTAVPEGEHTLVAFAIAGDTAGAFAWPFEVPG